MSLHHRGRWLASVLFAFHPFLLHGATEVHVSSLETVVVPTEEALHAICATDRRVVACTRFVREEMNCRCRKEGERWRLQPSASFAPITYTADMMRMHRNISLTLHETLHVRDVTERLHAYLVELASHEFDSESDCQTLAASVSDPAHFHSVMNRFRHESNLKFGCERRKIAD